MLRLFVMRHAKSSWAVPGARDFDRDLNERGREDLVLVSNALQEKQYFPETILCSPAARTRQTLEGIQQILPAETKISFNDQLYSGGMEDYLHLLQANTTGSSAMTIGHNPMSGTLAFSLCGDGNPAYLELISYKYPTSCVAIIDFDTDDWSEIGKHKGTLVECIIPSHLKKQP